MLPALALVYCRDLLQKNDAPFPQERRRRHRILRRLPAVLPRSRRDRRDDQRGGVEIPNVILQNNDRTAAMLHRARFGPQLRHEYVAPAESFVFHGTTSEISFSQIAKNRYFPPDA